MAPGRDTAGTIEEPAASGAGPGIGTRVVTWSWAGDWVELCAVHVDELVALPDEVDFVRAAALPGQRVAVTGVSGEADHLVVQLARLQGAHVVAVVGDTARVAGQVELGADQVIREPRGSAARSASCSTTSVARCSGNSWYSSAVS